MLREYAMDNFSPELFSSLVERIDLGVIVLDADLRILRWNDFIGQRSGKNQSLASGRPFLEAFPDVDPQSFAKIVELARDRGIHVYNHWLEQAPLLQLRAEAAGEEGLHLQSSLFFPFAGPGGELYFGLVLFDTGAVAKTNAHLESALKALRCKQVEQDNLLRKLETANNQLLQSEKLAAIGQLAAGVAHEINNPIGFVFSNLKTLSGYVQDLLKIIDAVDAVADLEELRQLKHGLEYDYIRSDVGALIDESEDGIDRVKRIISALKDFSHIEEEEFRPVDLHRGLDTTLNVVNNELKYKAEVIKEYADLPEVECIASQINQVAMNLLVNAAHSIEKFGRITLRTGLAQDEVWLEVEDTGKGIEPKVLNRIFEPFFTTKPVGKGTGLGLALSYTIVQKHNGRIEVKSEVGKGTRFRVYLPIKQPVEPPEPEVSA
jgi:signal transduction histidine kinase